MPARRSIREDIVYDDEAPRRSRSNDDYDGEWWRGRPEAEAKVQKELENVRTAGTIGSSLQGGNDHVKNEPMAP